MKDGVIADFEITEAMLRHFIRKVHNRRSLIRPRIIICVPSASPRWRSERCGSRRSRPGPGKSISSKSPWPQPSGGAAITEPICNMVVDIGGGTSEVAVISLAGIVYSKSVRVGGDKMDEAILQYIKRTYNLLIGAHR